LQQVYRRQSTRCYPTTDCSATIRGRQTVRSGEYMLVHKVRRSLKRLGATSGGLVVAVSGGPDSVALLRAVLTARPTNVESPVVIAHLNHGLRGAESDGDEAFVRLLHANLSRDLPGLRLACSSIDVADRAGSTHDNLENTARKARYSWLSDVAFQEKCEFVATGHTADDQAETVLHRLLRGTGIAGLRGIARRRPLSGGVTLVRPLLSVTRAEVLEYLAELGQAYRTDSSNRDPAFTRCRIRNELLPLLETYNPNISTVLCRLSEHASAIHKRMTEQAERLLQQTERPRAGSLLIFDREQLAAAPRSLVREVLRLAWSREGWPQGRMDFASWNRLAGVIFGENDSVDLPAGIRALRRGRVVQLGRHS
jgi:tRNA(Ile)-lysidine synthase